MKILHVISSLDTELGGPPRSTVGLCRALVIAGHHVTLLTQNVGGWRASHLNFQVNGGGSLITICARSTYLRGRHLATSHDLVQLQSVWNPQNVLLASHCSSKRIPYILAPRGELDAWSMRQKPWKKRFFMLAVGRRMIRQAAALHLLNDGEVEGLRDLGLTGRYFTSPNGIDAEEWSEMPAPGTFRREHPNVADKIIILFMARIHHKKGAGLLAKAYLNIVQKHQNVHLFICGPDFGERGVVEQILIEPRADGRADCLGMVTGQRRLALLQDADIFVLPSFQEGHPRNVLEAAYLGKALLITPCCHCPEFAHGEAAEVVEPSVEAISMSLEKLVTNATLRHRLGVQAARIVRNKFEWEQIALRTAMFYDACISTPENLAVL